MAKRTDITGIRTINVRTLYTLSTIVSSPAIDSGFTVKQDQDVLKMSAMTGGYTMRFGGLCLEFDLGGLYQVEIADF